MNSLLKLFIVSILFGPNLNNAQNKGGLQSQIKAMTLEINPTKNVASMHRIIREFNLDAVKNSEEIDVLKGITALSYLKIDSLKKFQGYINQIKNPFNQTSYLSMGAEQLFQDRSQLRKAEKLAQQTVELYNGYKDNTAARPLVFPEADWNRFVKMAQFPYYTSYAKMLHANHRDKKALFYLEKALQNQDLEHVDASIIELYGAVLELNGQVNKAYETLLSRVKSGKTSLSMIAQLKSLYIKKTDNKEKADAFIATVMDNHDNNFKKSVSKKMTHKLQAPNFTLLDVKGQRVSLTDYSGKIVVLDFWATWCTPCIASMPAMSQLSKRHPDVVFLFIATQETGKNISKRVKAFLDKRKFPTNSLLDRLTATDAKIFKVAAAYHLKGIPTKVVIDKKGKQRFLSTGFRSDTELIDEMEAVIALVKGE